jgi:Tol biopolymer transport system component
VVCLVALVAACGRLGFDEPGDAAATGSDGSAAADAPHGSRTCGPFGVPKELPGPVNILTDDEWAPAISFDDRTLYWYCFRSGTFDIWRATRASSLDDFTAPEVIPEVASSETERAPSVTRDELVMAFMSDRSEPDGDIYLASRATKASAFGAPVVVPELSSTEIDDAPELSGDGLRIVFHSNRFNGMNLFAASRPDRSSPFTDVHAIDELNTDDEESAPALSPDELEIFFISDRPGGSGQHDLWSATRPSIDVPFGVPVNLTILNSPGDEYGPSISGDGTHLYYSYNAPIGGGGSTAQVWVATRTCQ